MNSNNIQSRVKQAIMSNRHHRDIRSVALFGSQLNGRAGRTSDVDLLIDFEPRAVVGFIKFFDIKLDLERALDRKVDLIVRDGVSPYLKKEIIDNAKIIYER